MKTEENKVRQARLAQGLSQEEFARELNVSVSTIAKAEAGTPSEGLLLKINMRFGHERSEPIQANKSSMASIYRDALIQRLEQELNDWKQMALNLSQRVSVGKLNAVVNAGDHKRSLAAA